MKVLGGQTNQDDKVSSGTTGVMPVAKNSISIFSTQAVLVLLTACTGVVAARVLGPAGKGAFSLMVLVLTLLGLVGGLGQGLAGVYFIGKGKYPLSDIAGSFLFLAVLVGSLLFAVFFGVYKYVSPFLQGINPLYVFIMVSVLPLTLLQDYFSDILLAKNQIRRYNILWVIPPLFFLIFFIGSLFFTSNHLLAAALSWVAATIIQTAVVVTYVSSLTKIHFLVHLKFLKDSLSFGVKVFLGGVTSFFNYRLDAFLVSYFLGLANVGYYAVAVSFGELVWRISNSVSIALYPKVASSDSKTADSLTPVICRHTVFWVFVSCLFLFLSSKIVIPLAFGAAFIPAVIPLWILLPGVFMYGVSGVLNSDLTGRGQPIIGTYASGTALITTIGLDLLLIPKWGIAGAALASSVAYTLYAVIVLAVFLKISGRSFRDTLVIRLTDFKVYHGLLLKVISRAREWKKASTAFHKG